MVRSARDAQWGRPCRFQHPGGGDGNERKDADAEYVKECGIGHMRDTRIELASSAWEADVLPLN